MVAKIISAILSALYSKLTLVYTYILHVSRIIYIDVCHLIRLLFAVGRVTFGLFVVDCVVRLREQVTHQQRVIDLHGNTLSYIYSCTDAIVRLRIANYYNYYDIRLMKMRASCCQYHLKFDGKRCICESLLPTNSIIREKIILYIQTSPSSPSPSSPSF